MSYRIIIFLLAFISIKAYAKDDQIFVNSGFGLLNTGTQSKELNVGIQEDVWQTLKQRGSIGGWTDPGLNRSGSAFISGQLGIEVKNGLVASVFSGPSFISCSDSILRENFQIMTDVGVGIEDIDNNYIGLMYRNFSLLGYNNRNYLGLEIRFPF